MLYISTTVVNARESEVFESSSSQNNRLTAIVLPVMTAEFLMAFLVLLISHDKSICQQNLKDVVLITPVNFFI